MSNRFQPIALPDGRGDDGDGDGDADADDDSQEDDEDGEQKAAPRPPSPFARQFADGQRLLFRPFPEMLKAVEAYEAIERDCGDGDVYTVIKCASFTGDAYRMAAMNTVRLEDYASTLLYYDTSIHYQTRAIYLCEQRSLHQESTTSTADSDAQQLRLGDLLIESITIALEDVQRLRTALLRERGRVEANLQRSEADRDVVKAVVGPERWKAMAGNSHWAEDRERWRKQLRDIDAVLERIEASERERERMRAFEEAQRAKAHRLRQRMEARKEAARLKRAPGRWRKRGQGNGDGGPTVGAPRGGRGRGGRRGRGRGRGGSGARGGGDGDGGAVWMPRAGGSGPPQAGA